VAGCVPGGVLPGRRRARDIPIATARRSGAANWVPYITPLHTPLTAIPSRSNSRLCIRGMSRSKKRITAILRWNALAMVVRANSAYGELGGTIASYTSAAEIFEIGFNHFFHAANLEHGGDLIYFQAHPRRRVRTRVPGRSPERAAARQLSSGSGRRRSVLVSASVADELILAGPHRLHGIGPISAIYQARFMRYLQHRGLTNTSGRRVWGVFGDGEMDEPESVAALTLAAREQLDT